MLDLSQLSAKELKDLQVAMTPKTNKYIPITPTAKQSAALLMNGEKELLYGGAARAGVSQYIY